MRVCVSFRIFVVLINVAVVSTFLIGAHILSASQCTDVLLPPHLLLSFPPVKGLHCERWNRQGYTGEQN